MKILIATGIYPPQTGGPANYAYQLKREFESMGHEVMVRTFTIEHRLPTGVRHIVYFCKTLPAYVCADMVIALDTFSVGFPLALMYRLWKRCLILRTGGDFLWEAYVERTKEKILLSNFYSESRKFTLKEKAIFAATRFVVRTFPHVVFSTIYQKDIWTNAYTIPDNRIRIIENSYDLHPHVPGVRPKEKEFVCMSRRLWLKNVDALQEAFDNARRQCPDITLTVAYDLPHAKVMRRLENAYAAVVVSISEISPNFALEALSVGKPVLITKENGILDRIGPAVVAVDPKDIRDITRGIVALADERIYKSCQDAIAKLAIRHPYSAIAKEYLEIARRDRTNLL